ncbi:autotransporter outer membrane beta-barrel domain-containing protein [Rickettsia oklahomensis]|uniref:Autotransporter outer membrane beta-barrel domain-containing protein n=1 Tax=Rickettsia oklahomensis TaxID=3141789 RepID=A0AAU7BZ98_9RICK
MTNVFPKLFQKVIQKGLKTALFTTSTAALMMSSSGALGIAEYGVISTNNAAFSDNADTNLWHGITNAGADNNNPVNGPQNGDAFTFGGNHIITADEVDRIIQAINVADTHPEGLIINANTKVGSIITNNNFLDVSIKANKNLTLTGTAAVDRKHGFNAAANIYTGLKHVILEQNSELTIHSSTPALITILGDIYGEEGIVTVNTDTKIDGTIGNDDPLAKISVGKAILALRGDVVKANAINLTDNASRLTFTNPVVVTGAIDNTGNANNGVVTFAGNSTVTGNIGNTNALATLDVEAGLVQLKGDVVKANAINLTDNASRLTFTNPVVVTGAIDNTGNANNGVVTFAGNSTVTGNIGNTNALATLDVGAGLVQLKGDVVKANAINLTDNASRLTFTNPVVVTGVIDNTGNANNGVVTFAGNSTVTGNIGNTNALATLDVGAGLVQLKGDVVKANAINLTDNASRLTFTNPVVVTGAIDNTGNANNGVVTFAGNSTVTGNIGNTNALATLDVGAGLVQLKGDVVKANAINLTDNASKLTFTNPVVVTGVIDNTGNANNGVVTFAGNSTVTGNIGNTNALATLDVEAGLVQLKGDVVKANAINLTDNASKLTFTNPVVVTGAIDNTGNANNGVVTFAGNSTVTGNIGNTNALAILDVGAGLVQLKGDVVKANAINLTDNASKLTFTNPVVVTGVIDNTGNANNGVVTFAGNSTVTGNIGNTNALAILDVGAGLVQLKGDVVKANAINLTDNASKLTFTNPVVVTGAIDNTGNANNGVVTFAGNSTVTGNIGNTNALATLDVGAGLVQLKGDVVKANAINLTDNASKLTFTNPVVVTGAIDNTGNANNGVVTFAGNSTVTGNIGNTNALATLDVGAGLVQLKGDVVKANAINLTDNASRLTFTNPVVVTGAIDNTGNANNGVVTFAGNSTVTGNIGNTNALATLDVGAGLVQLKGDVVKANAINLTDNASRLTFTNPVVVTGAIDNTGNANNGVVTFAGNSTVTGNIGNTNALATLDVGAGLVQLKGDVVKANAINLTDNASRLTFTNPVVVTGAIDNTGNANNGVVTFAGNSTVTGNIGNTNALATLDVGAGLVQLKGDVVKANAINLTDNASRLTFTNPVVVTGAIDNTGNANNGVVTFAGNSTVTGNIGNTNALAILDVGAGLVQLKGDVVKANAINLTDNASRLTFTNPVVVTGAIDNTGNANNGVVTFAGNSTVTGNIGNTNALATLDVGAGLVQLKGDVVKANAINLTDNASRLTFTNPVVVTGAIDNTGNANNGVVTFAGNSTVTGNIGNTNALAILDVGAGLVQLKGDVVKANAINLTDNASKLTFTNPVVVTGAIDNTGNANNGVVTFAGNSTVTGNIGNTNALAILDVGAGLVQLKGDVVKANAINLTDNASRLTFTNPVVVTGAIDNTGNANNGVVTFAGNSTVTGNIGNTNALATLDVGAGLVQLKGDVVKANAINLTDNASRLTFTNPVVVTGAIDNTGNANNGVVTFAGNSTVTGNIGNTNALETLNVGAGATLQAGGSIAANNIDFGVGGTLEFNGPDGPIYNLTSVIVNGNNGTLNINAASTVMAHDASIGEVALIDIQNDKNFGIDVKNADVNLLNGQVISFKGANSSLLLLNNSIIDDRVITLKNDLPAFATGGGNLTLISATKLITLQGDGGAKAIGTGGNELGSLSIFGNVAFNNIDTTNVIEFNILSNTKFIDVGSTTNQINRINIGAANTIFAAGEGSYTIDTEGANAINILANGQTINFAHEDAELVLQNSAAGNGRITLNAILDPFAPNKGKIVVNSEVAGGKIILASVDGATYGTKVNRLKELEFKGNGTIQVDTDIFANNLALSVPAINYNKDINANLTFKANTVLTQNGNINGNVDFNNHAAAITLGIGQNINGSVTSSNGVNGTIIASGASTIKGAITNLAMLKVGAGNVTITTGGNTSINEIQGNGMGMLTMPAINLIGGINKTGGQTLKLNFNGGGSVSDVVGNANSPVGDITTAGTMRFASSVNAKGTATFSGTTSFADMFTNTGPVILGKGFTYNFAKDVTATSFQADGATMNFGNNLSFNSAITGSGTTITLGANQVIYKGSGDFTDTLTLNTIFDGAVKSGGNILIKSGSTLDLSGVSTLALVVTATNFDINNIDPNTKYTVIYAETAGGLKPAPADNVKITINNENRFVDFTFDASSLTLFAEDISGAVIEKDFTGVTQRSLEIMAQAQNGSDARQALNNDFGCMTNSQVVEAVSHLIQDVVKPSDTIANVNNQIITSNISSSLINLNARIDELQPASISAGDEDRDAKFGAWITPFVGNATQKMSNNVSGYKSDTTGGTIGFDGLVSDDLMLGIAYTRADTDIKLKNNKTGDKNKVQTNIYSLYSLYNLPYENFFVEAITAYSDNTIRSKSRRIAAAVNTVAYQTASGKYKSESYVGQLMAGYTYVMPENINLTPVAGLRYLAIKDKGYKETGATYQNLIIKGKTYNSFDGMLGAKLSSNINVSDVVLKPELYAMVDYAFRNKVPAIDARLQGMAQPFPTNSLKQNKISFDVGIGVTAKYKMMEYSINYDTNIGSKYFAQQGSVKVRVNF